MRIAFWLVAFAVIALLAHEGLRAGARGDGAVARISVGTCASCHGG
jgi:cytochrome c553